MRRKKEGRACPPSGRRRRNAHCMTAGRVTVTDAFAASAFMPHLEGGGGGQAHTHRIPGQWWWAAAPGPVGGILTGSQACCDGVSLSILPLGEGRRLTLLYTYFKHFAHLPPRETLGHTTHTLWEGKSSSRLEKVEWGRLAARWRRSFSLTGAISLGRRATHTRGTCASFSPFLGARAWKENRWLGLPIGAFQGLGILSLSLSLSCSPLSFYTRRAEEKKEGWEKAEGSLSL